MKKLLAIPLLGALFAMPLFFSGIVNAQTFRTGTNVSVGQSETIDGTLYTSGQTVDIASEVDGDVYCAGQTVTISGHIRGDIMCAAQNITVSGLVDGDVRLAGQTVSIASNVTGSATIAAQTFNLDSKGRIGRDITLGTANGVINGAIGRDIVAGSGQLTVAGDVGRNIEAEVSDLQLGSNARVSGNVTYTSTKEVSRSNGAEVGGTITRNEPSKNDSDNNAGVLFGLSIGWFVYCLLAMLLLATAVALLAPSVLNNATGQAMLRPWRALLVGFLASIVVPIAIILLAVTIIGIPLAIVMLLAWFLIVILSSPVFAYYLGRNILRSSAQPLVIMAVGIIIAVTLYFIPVIGFIFMLVSLWMGAGMLLLELFRRSPKREDAQAEEKHKLIKTVEEKKKKRASS